MGGRPEPDWGGASASRKRAEIGRLRELGLSYTDIARKLGLSKATVAYHARRLGIPADDRFARRYEWAVIQRAYDSGGRPRSRHHLKWRLLREGLKENRCEECRLTEWSGKPLNMALHHVNGDGRDNRLENLKFLCPTCHAQTPNYGGRNGHWRKRQAAKAA
jgi:DNA-binding transcriptional ArsR family regulator